MNEERMESIRKQLTPETRLRLDKHQEALVARGVRNISFFKGPEWETMTYEERALSICVTLDAIADPSKLTPYFTKEQEAEMEKKFGPRGLYRNVE